MVNQSKVNEDCFEFYVVIRIWYHAIKRVSKRLSKRVSKITLQQNL